MQNSQVVVPNFALQIMDPESGAQYKIMLNEEDYLRALKDDYYVNTLLQQAKKQTEESVEVEDENQSKNTYNWKYEQVIELIKSMGTHIEDFNHPKKRNHVFEHVSNDLLSKGFNVSPSLVRNKWNGLNKSYRKAKDIKSKSGRGPSRFMFFELLEDILGSHPTNSCKHSLNTLIEVNEKTTEERNIESSSTNITKIADTDLLKTVSTKKRNLKREYIEFKKEESVKKAKRHEEMVKVEKEKIELEKNKLELLERYLSK